MVAFRELLDGLAAGNAEAAYLAASLVQPTLRSLARQPEIRFYVDGTRHLGHQASTVALLRRVIERTRYTGRIRVVYNDSDKVKPGSTASKLAVMIAGLDPRAIDSACVGYRTCRDIRFVAWRNRATLADDVEYGFTGAADDMGVNLAAELHVNLFVRLQPFLWDDEEANKSDPYYVCSRIETRDGRFFYPVDEHESFRRLSYGVASEPTDDVPDDVWGWYRRQSFDPELGLRTTNARVLYDMCRAHPSLFLWPCYGMHHFTDRIAEMALNIVVVGLQLQTAAQRPVVIALMNRQSAIPSVLDLIEPLSRDLATGNAAAEQFRAALATMTASQIAGGGTRAAERLDAFMAEVAPVARQWIGEKRRVTILTCHDAARGIDVDISERLSVALSGATNRDLLVVVLGPVPRDVYQHFYANSRLPGLFEGQASSTIVMSRGRPFLQVPREGHVILNGYPLKVGQDDLTTVATAANDAALQLRDQRPTSYVRADGPGDPREYWLNLGRTSEFILAAIDPASDVSRYFRRLGDVSRDEASDKWMVALLALATLTDGADGWTTSIRAHGAHA